MIRSTVTSAGLGMWFSQKCFHKNVCFRHVKSDMVIKFLQQDVKRQVDIHCLGFRRNSRGDICI